MAYTTQNWLAVPQMVADLFVKYSADACKVVGDNPDTPDRWVIQTEELGPVRISANSASPGWKQAAEGVLPAVGTAGTVAQTAMGGPNPLTSMLLGSALGAGLGYGGGWLMHKMMPEYVDERAARNWAILGGLGGAVPGAVLHGRPNVKELGWGGLLMPSRTQGRKPLMVKENYARNDELNTMLFKLAAYTGVMPADNLYTKEGLAMPETYNPYNDYVPAVNTDDWGRAVNRDPYLQAHEKALAAGLPIAATAYRGSTWVSPMDVAQVAGGTMLGAFYGKALGSIAAPFLGLTPKAQEGLQQAGMLAGAVRSLGSMAMQQRYG